ncbi:MAG: hypothetical protein GY778_16915 [bacterium]|nr:hypothetical protein [bacterium]
MTAVIAAWNDMGSLLVVVAPLVGVPLTVITFYLRALREYQSGKLTELDQRVDRLDTLADALNRRIGEVERDYTTKEEWIRESMWVRSERQWLTETVARLEVESQASAAGPARRIDRAARATAAASERVDRLYRDLHGKGRGRPRSRRGSADGKR